MKDKNIVLQLKSSDELISFLKRFSSITGSLLIEFEDGFIKAKSHTPERSVVKSSKIALDTIFNLEEGETVQNTKFGIYSVDRLIKSFSHFGDSSIQFILDLEQSQDGIVGTGITLKNESLDINYQCASLRLFTYISDEMMDKITDNSSSAIDFVLTKEIQARINSLTSIDADQKLLTISIKKGLVKASGKSFNLNLLNVDDTSIDTALSVYKSQFALLDKEDQKIFMVDDRLIFHSLETDTKMIVGKAE